MSEVLRRPIIIAGPCAAENMDQIEASIREIKSRDIPIMRASLVKPRTSHSWDGVGLEAGIPLLKRVQEEGITPATEVLNINDAKTIVDGVLGQDDGEIMLWIGARNQNHQFQRDLGRLAATDTRVTVGAKNQPWTDENHFRGIISHMADAGGADRSRLLMMHRGFSLINSDGYRNAPDFEMALRIKEEEGVKMLLDPSHIGGERKKVIEVAKKGMQLEQHGVIFDGMMIEVHPSVETARTDQQQQLTWTEFDLHINPVLKEGVLYDAAD